MQGCLWVMSVPLNLISLLDCGCSITALSLQVNRNAGKTLLYLEIHHCDIHPNIMVSLTLTHLNNSIIHSEALQDSSH